MNNLNNNSQAVSDTLTLNGAEYWLPSITPEPFNYLSANFNGWDNNSNTQNVSFSYNNWGVLTSPYRYRNSDGNITAVVKDQWNNGATVSSPVHPILIDTYVDNSTDLNETFNGESKRYTNSGFTATWDSTQSLVDGQALVMGGQMMIPSYGYRTDNVIHSDWIIYKPNLNGTNPDYTSLSNPSSFYRKFIYDTGTADLNNCKFTFTGTFASGDALTDLKNEDLQIFVRLIGSAVGGFTGSTAPPAIVHGTTVYSSGGDWDSNQTGSIRVTDSPNNEISCSFGVYPAKIGILVEIKIINPSIRVSSLQLIFNG